MSAPNNELQALLAGFSRSRPSPSSTPAPDPGMMQYPQHYQHHQHQHGYRPMPPPHDGQSYNPHLHQPAYRHPSVSALQSPSPANTPPHHGSDIISPTVHTPSEAYPPQHQHQPQGQHPDGAVNLLNLLKYHQPHAAQSQQAAMSAEQPVHTHPSVPAAEGGPKSHTRNVSASDFVATLFARPGQAAAATPGHPGIQQMAQQPAPGAENPQDMLLRLLNRPKSGQAAPEAAPSPPSISSQNPFEPSSHTTFEPQSENPFEPELGSVTPSTQGVFEAADIVSGGLDKPSAAGKETLFTHVNPFEQLAAVSRNRTPQSTSREQSPVVEASKTEPLLASQARPERVKSPSLADEQKEAVSSVVDRLVGQITRDVDESYEKMTREKRSAAAAPEDTKATLLSTANAVQDALDEPQVLKETTTATAAGVKDTSNGSGEALVDSWESAEDSAEKDEERVVPVHNFPLRPFISIIIKPYAGKLLSLRDDGIMDIARLKKEFDQLDRSLTSATPDYIVYALAKNGGMRIIRQDDGSDKQVLRSTRDRIFNVSVCTSQSMGGSSEDQAVLGIGVSGAVYWVLISRGDKDLFEQDALESECLIFPPFPASDENTSGGQLKTRAKRSSRHPGFFAIGRGKNIYVISPQAAASPAYGVSGNNRTVNTEKFFKERALKISTGKAGKDFVFSDDDTVIASLDKTGRLRFWDIRRIVNSPDAGVHPDEIRVPLNTFVTGSPTEKSWPTSVLFIDKLRAYSKSMALRYVLVGLKQNHTLQLWDIGLGKAVQELKFPHDNESDAICSVAYHAPSGILVVGHPTRNSIYFVHLSTPRYNLQPMSQAAFIQHAVNKDASLPKPESTACLSGIREISFASKGQLRSLDLLPITKAAGDENSLFELYAMHSRGVTCLNIKKDDLGWSQDNKIIRPVDALEKNYIEFSELQSFPTYLADEPSVNGDSVSTPTKPVSRDFVKASVDNATESSAGATPSVLRNQSPVKVVPKKKQVDEPVDIAPSVGSVEKLEKKKKKKAAASAEPVKPKEPVVIATPAHADRTNGESSRPAESIDATPASARPIPGGETLGLGKHIEALQNGVTSEFNKSLGRELQGIYTRFDEERRSWDAASADKQDQVLRLVSSTLSDNVEKNLTRIVSSTIQSEVVPALTDLTSAAVSTQLNAVLSQQSGVVISRELQQSLPSAVTRALQQPGVMKVVSDAVGQKMSAMESQISKAMHDALTPTLKNIALRAAEKVGQDVERQMQAQMKRQEIQLQNDATKIDQLTTLVRGLSDTVAAMAASQTGFQKEVLRLNQVIAQQAPAQHTPEKRVPEQPVPEQSATSISPVPLTDSRSPAEREIAEITQVMREGRYEEGSVKWLQSEHQADLFDNLFVRLNPSYLNGLPPIVALSVGVAVTSSLQTNVMQRLTWLEVALQTVNLVDPDILEVAPRIMDILIQRLDGLYMSVAKDSPHDPILRRIAPIVRRARMLHSN
ncbi:hypothetical protein BJX99DRAFT_225155 [Aspergillus californicus]